MDGHIYIDGVISNDYHLQVKRQLDALKDADKIIVHIQSPGGSVYAGYNTYHVLKSAGKPVEAIIEGECQSIATFISLAADKVVARNPSIYMIHNPYTYLEGDASVMENGASELRKIEDTMISAYQAKTKLSEDKLREMMSKETTMTAYEAQKMGFVDEIVDQLRAVAIGKTKIKMQDKLDQFGAKMTAILKEVFSGPVNSEVPLKDGTMVTIEGEGDLVGQVATINGEPAPAGEHELANGQIIVVGENGVITEVKAPMSPAQVMEQENAKLKAELEALKAEKAQSDSVLADAQAKNSKTVQMLAELQKEFMELRKMTVGNPNPAPVAPVAMVKPSEEVAKADVMTEEFINEFLPHFKRK